MSAPSRISSSARRSSASTRDADQLMAIFANMEGSACVILTENMRYAGVVSAASLIKVINEKQLKMAQDQNPLTGLPGNRAIRDFMQAGLPRRRRDALSSAIATSTISSRSTIQYGFHASATTRSRSSPR